MSARALTRKRSRAQVAEDDELASEVVATPLLSSAKRKKLKTEASSPAKSSIFGSLRKGVGGMLVWSGNEKENVREEEEEEEEEEEDELADEDGTTRSRSKSKAERDIFEIPNSDSEEELQIARMRNATQRLRIPSIPQKMGSTKSTASARKTRGRDTPKEPAADIYDVPSDEPAPSSSKKPTHSLKRDKTIIPLAVGSSDAPRKRGRPSKNTALKNEKKLSNQAIRDAMASEKEKAIAEEHGTATPRRRSVRKDRAEESPTQSAPQSKASPAARRKEQPARHPTDALEPEKEFKSALTPLKKKRGRPRKSVAFEQTGQVDLGFKDLDTTTSAKKARSMIPVVEIHQSEDPASPHVEEFDEDAETEVHEGNEANDEIACAMCRKLHSGRKNPIILCDNCSYAIHLKCSDLEAVPDEDESWCCELCAPDPNRNDIACAVCSRRNFSKKNTIILCEKCDFGIHLFCSEMEKVPRGVWLCKGCEPDPKPEDISFTKLRADTTEVLSACPDIAGFEDNLRCMQRIVLDKLTGHKRTKLRGHEEEMRKVYQIVEQTILAGEGNSMLVIGARGCGKTTLVETVISDLTPAYKDNFHVVRLNGFIHTDDKLALKEIWRQLGREMEVEDDTTGRSNYADTLASLLALLSHPSEISESQSDQTAKSVIFILDEFDLFTTHSRQTLLYNLFDIAQAKKAPIVVLGLTTRVDVVDSLEKRVKSRFSHRYVHLSLAKSLPAFWEICKEGLSANAEEFDTEASSLNAASQDEFLSFWQKMVEDLYEKDVLFKHHVQSYFYRSKSVPAFFTSCILPLAGLSTARFPLTGKAFTSGTQSLSAPDSKLQILQGLSELELALLIAAARLDIIQDTDTCNFAMAYDEYSSLTSRHKIQTSSAGVAALGASAKVWGRDVALGAWERLSDYELLVPAGIGGGAGRDFSAGGRMWKVDVGLEEITGSVDGMSSVMTKWCREI